jgi:hypothetical protein
VLLFLPCQTPTEIVTTAARIPKVIVNISCLPMLSLLLFLFCAPGPFDVVENGEVEEAVDANIPERVGDEYRDEDRGEVKPVLGSNSLEVNGVEPQSLRG